eukprot:489875-Hanusia_phi.AAC.1
MHVARIWHAVAEIRQLIQPLHNELLLGGLAEVLLPARRAVFLGSHEGAPRRVEHMEEVLLANGPRSNGHFESAGLRHAGQKVRAAVLLV